LQVAAPQAVPDATLAHMPAPSHLPVIPQTSGLCGMQRACGSSFPGPTLAHWPALPGTLQDWQIGHVLEAQQTPSPQNKPVWQSMVTLHIWPAGCWEPQRLFFGSHRFGGTQSVLALQFTRQALLPLHRNAPHDLGMPVTRQLPLPSHCLAGVNVDIPVGHDAGTHSVPAGYCWQAPVPSHWPSVPQLPAPLSGQRASGVLFATGLHVPTVPCKLQATQALLQALLQQTPWAQFPLAHSTPLAHCAPSGLRPQDPFVHTLPAEQSASAVHVALQAIAPQANGTQDIEAGVTQVPAPSQADPGVKLVVPARHTGGKHAVPAAYFWQPPPSHLPLLPQVAGP